MCWSQDPSDRPTFDVIAPLLNALYKAKLKEEQEEEENEDDDYYDERSEDDEDSDE